jgi:drug/metabolite transporter (DMT)-like permease
MERGALRLDATGWMLLITLAVLWSASFVFIKVAGATIPAFTLVLVRVGVAALVLHAVVLGTRRRYPVALAVVGRYAVMGLMNNVVPFVLIVWATARLGAGAASILNATAPIFALVVAHFATADERITPAKTLGILCALGGVVAMMGGQAVAGIGENLAAGGAMLIACLFYGISAVYGRNFTGLDATVSATCQLSASTLMLLPLALALEQPWALGWPGLASFISAIALAVLSTGLAYVIFYALIARAGATNTILVTLLIPVGGVFFGWMLLGEPFTIEKAAGILLIGLGLIVVDGRALRLIHLRWVSAGG